MISEVNIACENTSLRKIERCVKYCIVHSVNISHKSVKKRNHWSDIKNISTKICVYCGVWLIRIIMASKLDIYKRPVSSSPMELHLNISHIATLCAQLIARLQLLL